MGISLAVRFMDLWQIERELDASGYEIICGVDEAGRGPLAGPVFAAAVVLPLGIDIPGLNDSKKLSEKVRERLYDEIIAKAICFAVASADHKEIDDINILQATFLAMRRAVNKLSSLTDHSAFRIPHSALTYKSLIKISPDFALIDGNRAPGLMIPCRCVVGGDGKSASIAAASILAKVSRDRFMIKLAGVYPQYGFERHKGYPTKLHYERLREYGPSDVHRRTFLGNAELGDGG